MLNFGLTELRLVKPRDGWPNPDANAMAAGAVALIENAKVFETTAAAVADLKYVLAATARRRELEVPVIGTGEVGAQLHAFARDGVATGILFGPEKAGLTNEDVVLRFLINYMGYILAIIAGARSVTPLVIVFIALGTTLFFARSRRNVDVGRPSAGQPNAFVEGLYFFVIQLAQPKCNVGAINCKIPTVASCNFLAATAKHKSGSTVKGPAMTNNNVNGMSLPPNTAVPLFASNSK